ncbi:MAG: hypothetical protein MJE77_31675 [Proteobacteria bacterium]|nr:hypothetical protein [Pseudomonadota bacterium]
MRSVQRGLLGLSSVALVFVVACPRQAPRPPGPPIGNPPTPPIEVCQAISLNSAQGCPPDKCGAPLQMVGDDPVEIDSGEIIIHGQGQPLRGSDVVGRSLPFVGQLGQTGELLIEEYNHVQASSEHLYRLTRVPPAVPAADRWYRVTCATAAVVTE